VDEGTNRIIDHLETEREALGRNLDEMESRVKDMTDPKVFFDKHTGWILSAAIAGGFILSAALGKAAAQPPQKSRPVPGDGAGPVKFGAAQLQRVGETFDTILDGLVDVVSDKLYSFVADAVPGFQKPSDGRQRARSA